MLLQKQRTSRGLSSTKGRRKSKIGSNLSGAVKNNDAPSQDNMLHPSKIQTPKHSGSRAMSANALFAENTNSDKPIEFS